MTRKVSHSIFTDPDRIRLTGHSRAARTGCESSSGAREQQSTQANDIVRRRTEGEDPGHQSTASVSQFSEAADRLHPAKGLFDELAFSLTDRVAAMARRPPINRTATIRGVLRHVRRQAHLAQFSDERGTVVALIHAEGDPIPGQPVSHDEG